MKRKSTIKTEYLPKYSPMATQIGILYVAPATIGEVLDLPKDQSSIDPENFGKDFFRNHVKIDRNDKDLENLSDLEINELHSVEIWNIVQTIIPNEEADPLDIDSGPIGNPYILLTKNLYDQNSKVGKINRKIGKSLSLTGLVSEDIKQAMENNIVDLKRITEDSKNRTKAQNRYSGPYAWNLFSGDLHKSLIEKNNLTPRPPLVSHAQRTADAVEASLQELADVAHRTESMARSMGELTGTVGVAVKEFLTNVERQKQEAADTFKGAKRNLMIAFGALIISAALPLVQMIIDHYKNVADERREIQTDATAEKQLKATQDILETLQMSSSKSSPFKFELNDPAIKYSGPEIDKR